VLKIFAVVLKGLFLSQFASSALCSFGRRYVGVWLIVALLLVFSTLLARAQQPSPTFDPTQVTLPTSPPLARAGGAIYQENCAPCHGTEGRGDGPTAATLPGPATPFADPASIWEKWPVELFHTAKFGRLEKLMPPWQNRLNDDQIWQAVTFAWSLHTSMAEVEQGATLYAQECVQCHGVSGAGDGPEATGDLPNFGELTYAMNRSQADWQAGWQTAHADLGDVWSEAEQRAVLEYLRTFSYSPPWVALYRPGVGALEGAVTQGTPGAPTPAELTATLNAFVNFEPAATFTTTLGENGGFRFSELATDSAVAYMVTVDAAGIRYSSDILTFSPQQTTLTTTIALYETTDDPSGVQIDRLHWIIDSQPGALIVGQVFRFGSTADRTFVGQPVQGVDVPVTVAMRLPPGAAEITFENGALGERFRQVDNTVYDTAPVIPGAGSRQIVMRFVLPHDGGELQLNQEFLYPVNQATLLVAEVGQLKAETADLTFVNREEIQGQSYLLWQAEPLAAHKVAIQLTGLLARDEPDPRALQNVPGAATSATMATVIPQLETWTPWTLGGMLGVLLFGVLIWSWQQRHGQTRDPVADLRQQRNVLLQRIAHLDDRRALQEVDETLWQRERTHLKAQLIEVTRRLSPSSAG
jgi:mono/diheme cytochrome c family protein